MDNMLLKNLIENLPKKQNIKIKGLTINSKKLKKFYFFAIKGNKFNGKNILTK